MTFAFGELAAWWELSGKDEWVKKEGTEEGKFNCAHEAQRSWLWTGACFRKTGVFLSKDKCVQRYGDMSWELPMVPSGGDEVKVAVGGKGGTQENVPGLEDTGYGQSSLGPR